MSRPLAPVFALAGVNLRRIARDPIAVSFTFVIPVLLIVVLGLAFGNPSIRVGVVVERSGSLGTELRAALDRLERVDLRDYDDPSSLERAVARDDVTAGVVIPVDYDADLRAGRDVDVILVTNPANSASIGVRSTLAAAVRDQAAVAGAARFARDRTGGTFEEQLARAEDLAGEPTGVTVEERAVGEPGLGALGTFGFAAIGQLVLFLFILGLGGGAGVVVTRNLGITKRMLTTPMTPAAIIAGHALGRFLLAAVQATFIVVVAAVLFDVDWGDPLAVAAVVGLWALISTGAGLLVGTLTRTEEQVTSVGGPVGMGLGMLGGCLWPLVIVPPVMVTIGHLTPHAWAVDALTELAENQGGVGTIATELLVLVGFAAALLGVSVRRLRRAITA